MPNITLPYLSPTSVNMALNDPEQFYMQYLTGYKPREPQTLPMSVGSAFDAYVKAYLYKELVAPSKHGNSSSYELEHLFESQVESQNRDWARSHGGFVFGMYKQLGSLSDLLLDLRRACESTGVLPIFESKIEALVNGVPLLGKPDLYFRLPPSDRWPNGTKIVFDWKVNGYCSKSAVSPVAGYAKIRGGRTSGSCHKEAQLCYKSGMAFNVNGYFEHRHESWASQLAIYSWVLDGMRASPEETPITASAQSSGASGHEGAASRPQADGLLAVIEETEMSKNPEAYQKIKEWVQAKDMHIHEKGTFPHWVQVAGDPEAQPVMPKATPELGSIPIPVAIDQLCCQRHDPDLNSQFVDIRVAEHRMLISPEFQQKLLKQIRDVWVAIHAGTIVPPERAAILDSKAKFLKDTISSNDQNSADKLLASLTKKPYYG